MDISIKVKNVNLLKKNQAITKHPLMIMNVKNKDNDSVGIC